VNAQTVFDGANIRPFDAAKLEIDDLFAEADNWLTGEPITSAEEAEAVEKLLDLARKAKANADAERKRENEPFDTGKAEVQARYNPILKRADMVAETCKAVLQPWRDAIAKAKAAEAEKARQEADEARRIAEEAIRNSAGNIAARAEAETKLNDAKIAEADARRVEKKAVTGNGLRTTYVPYLTDLNAAIKHYWTANRPEFEALVCDLATKDVRAGKREIPGFSIEPVRSAI
jgi:hypothetical protein